MPSYGKGTSDCKSTKVFTSFYSVNSNSGKKFLEQSWDVHGWKEHGDLLIAPENKTSPLSCVENIYCLSSYNCNVYFFPQHVPVPSKLLTLSCWKMVLSP